MLFPPEALTDLRILAAHTGVAVSNCLAHADTLGVSQDRYQHGGLVVSLSERIVTVDRSDVHLTRMQYRLLSALCFRAGWGV